MTAPRPEDKEVERDMAIRAVEAAIDQLYETIPAAFAHYFATNLRDEADRKYRQKRQANG
jgi:hypothetical protein